MGCTGWQLVAYGTCPYHTVPENTETGTGRVGGGGGPRSSKSLTHRIQRWGLREKGRERLTCGGGGDEVVP